MILIILRISNILLLGKKIKRNIIYVYVTRFITNVAITNLPVELIEKYMNIFFN